MIEVTYPFLIWLIAIDLVTSALAVWAFTSASKHLRAEAFHKARAQYAVALLEQVRTYGRLTGEQEAELDELCRDESRCV